MPACHKAAFKSLACSPWISSKLVFPLMFRAVLLKLQGATQQQAACQCSYKWLLVSTGLANDEIVYCAPC